MKTKILILLSLFAIATLNQSCKKKKGCTDVQSANYDADAEENDGSCRYEGKVIFWWNKTVMDSCAYYGVDNLKFYVDNVFQGAAPVSSQYWSSAPDCGANAAVTATIDLGNNVNKNVEIKIDFVVNGTTYATATETQLVEAKKCEPIELQW